MNKEALIIFVRQPEWGKVKTRLAAAVGNDQALAVYRRLLAHTHSVTAALPCDKFVFYSDTIGENDLWHYGYGKRRQANGNLGERMKAAFAELFQQGYQQVVIIGSDCFALTTAMIETAFQELSGHQVVIGPATDGGYYLLGMQGSVKELFDHIDWSTDKVFSQTQQHVAKHQYTCKLLPVLPDVDTIADVPESWLLNSSNAESTSP